MNIAYIISAYKYPEQLIRLVVRLSNEKTFFFVHIDKKTDDKIYQQIVSGLSNIPNVYFLKRRFVFPGKLRFNSYYSAHVQPTIKGRILSALWFALVFWFPIKRKFPEGFRPFAGDSYWCLSKECVEYIHNFIQQNPGFVNFFKYVDIPDEMLFQTIVLNSPFKESVINDDLLYADWKNLTLERPAILGSNDFEKIFNSSKLFARKFDTTRDTEILNMIDQKLLKTASKIN